MPNPAIIFRIVTEVVFVLLGLLLVWLAATGRTDFNSRSVLWFAVSVLILYRGLRAWLGAGKYASRWHHRLRGGSLVVVGVVMLGLVWAPEAFAGPLLVTAGIVLAARGLLGSLLAAREA